MSDPDDGLDVAIARQAILDAQRAVVGYELFDRSAAGAGAVAHSAAMLLNTLAVAGSQALAGKRAVFIKCAHETLADAHLDLLLDLLPAEKVVLEVPPAARGDAAQIGQRTAALAGLRARGFRLAFNQAVLKKAYAPWLALASFIKLDMSAFKPAAAQALVKFARASNPEAQLIAERVETVAQFDLMRGLEVRLFQGYWFARPSLVQTSTLRPTQSTVIQLIDLVRKQADTDEIEALLKKDPALSFNLLRFINSSAFGLSVEVTSFRHAVMILGLKKLFRWAALLMTTSRASGAAPAVSVTAVVRGRLMELLAAESLVPEECDNAFVVGVFSLLDMMLGVPLEKAIETVTLPQPVLDALLHGSGTFAPFLELAIACEAGNEESFARAASALRLSNRQVNWAHLQALAWAESLSEGIG